jgi:anti-sigma regulatory factor (Ser/Thr protein kinase)
VTPRAGLPPVQDRRLSGGALGGGWGGVRGTRMSRHSSLVLGALPGAVPCARLHARQVLWEWAVPVDADTAELLISELVTNGLKAAWATGSNQPLSLTLSAGSAVLAIEVWDGNPHPPVLRELDDDVPPLDEENGRGLFLVHTLSEKWGWYPTSNPAGKVTWCEIQAPVGDSRSGRS